MKSVQMKGSRFSIERESDGRGDYGMLYPTEDDSKLEKRVGLINVGQSVFCGAWRATMFGADTYWITTKVTEILEVNDDKTEVKFKTGNSIYIAKSLNAG